MKLFSKKNCIVLFLIFGLFSCGQDINNLGNGYSVSHISSENTSIVKGLEIVIHTNVVQYEVTDEFVTGLRVISKKPLFDNHIYGSPSYGYFILNTKTGKLIEGLEFEPDITELKRRK